MGGTHYRIFMSGQRRGLTARHDLGGDFLQPFDDSQKRGRMNAVLFRTLVQIPRFTGDV